MSDRAPGRVARSRTGAEHAVGRARVRAEKVRGDIPAAEAGWEAFQRDVEVGGPLISGAVAFRMFLWLLPFTLLTVVGFGFLADAGDESAQQIARDAGIRGLAAQSIAQAMKSSTRGRWLLLALAVIALVSASNSLLKAFWRSHELAWGLPRTKPPSKVKAVAALVGLAVLTFSASALASKLRDDYGGRALFAMLLVGLVWGGIWLFSQTLLPHPPDVGWTALIPGALLVGFATELLHLVTVYYLATKVGSSSALYGGLGAAAAMLGWFYLMSRAVVASAVLNATLHERRKQGIRSGWRRLADEVQNLLPGEEAREQQEGDAGR